MKRALWSSLVLLVVGSNLPSSVHAQSADPDVFEVASIKPNRSLNGWTVFRVQPGGRFTVTNASLREIIAVAYRVRNDQISGGPGWIVSERFDVTAKASRELPPLPSPLSVETSTPPALRMMRALLAERFNFAAHVETRDGPAYNLVLSRSDRKLGPRLTPSTINCDAVLASRRALPRTAAPSGAPPPPPPPPRPDEPPVPCSMGGGPGGLVVGGTMPIERLTRTLGSIVNRPVIDRTNLAGNFDFVLTFTPEQMPPMPPGFVPNDPPGAPVADSPSIFTALQEQLGLKLESTRAPQEFLMIDHVERPTAN